MKNRAARRSLPGPVWSAVAVTVCCASLLLGALAPHVSTPVARTGISDASASLLTGRSPSPAPSSAVIGRICLSLQEFLSDNQSCPDKGSPQDVEWDASNGFLLISNAMNGGVWVVSPTSGAVLTTLEGGAEFDGAAVDPASGDIYVPNGNAGQNEVTVYSGTNFTPIMQVPVGTQPAAVLIDPANGDVYVANEGSDNVSVIDSGTNRVIANIPVGGGSAGPSDLTLDSGTGNIYVTGEFNGAVVLNASRDRVVANVSLGTWATGMAYDPENGELYAPNVDEDDLVAINGTTGRFVGNISIYTTWYSSGDDPVTAAFDPSTGSICVTNFFSPDIDVVPGSANSLMTVVRASNFGWGIAFDPSNGYGYATSYTNDTVTVFTTPRSYPVTFVQTGLAPGVNWTVATAAIDGWNYVVDRTTSLNQITIVEPNGTFLLWASADNYSASPERATLSVTGAPLTVPINFSAVPAMSAGSSSGIPLVVWYGVAAAVAVLIVLAAVALTVRSHRRGRHDARGPDLPEGSNGNETASDESGPKP